jgi:hypothetical protein
VWHDQCSLTHGGWMQRQQPNPTQARKHATPGLTCCSTWRSREAVTAATVAAASAAPSQCTAAANMAGSIPPSPLLVTPAGLPIHRTSRSGGVDLQVAAAHENFFMLPCSS